MTSESAKLRARALASLATVLALAAIPAFGQTHKVTTAQPESVVRAIGVYEWTGDMAKPTASRLIPITLFIEGKFQDAAVYMARPVPFALLTGNSYQLQKAGNLQGAINLAFARHFMAAETSGSAYDDGWFGYGKFVPPAAVKKAAAQKPAKNVAVIDMGDYADDKPHFSARSAAPGTGSAATPKPGAAPETNSPSDDPDRPTMRRHTDSSDKTDSTTASSPADDPDRPSLRRRSTDDAKKARDEHDSVTPVANSLNDDPNRPVLHRGKPSTSLNEQDIPKLSGLPGDHDLHQMVAVSDAVDRTPHDFARAWEDEAEHQAILGKMQTAAREQLTAYEKANDIAPATPPPAPSAAKAAPRAAAARARRPVVKEMPPPPPEALMDEQLTGYTLSYGGAATFVYFAHTDGLGAAQRFVTLVAQVNGQGEPVIAVKNVTDAAHLDRTPRMRLVDAVDAEASNRASLLFELRAQNSRQFALYRVIGAHADQTYLSGSTQ